MRRYRRVSRGHIKDINDLLKDGYKAKAYMYKGYPSEVSFTKRTAPFRPGCRPGISGVSYMCDQWTLPALRKIARLANAKEV